MAALLGAALLQFGLGIATLLLAVPVALGALHQAGALLLFTTTFIARQAISSAPEEMPAAAPQLDGAKLDGERAALL